MSTYFQDTTLALSVIDFHDPYEEVQIYGGVVEFRDDSSFTIMDEISHKYTGKPFPFRNPEGRVALIIEVEKARYTKLLFEHTPRRRMNGLFGRCDSIPRASLSLT